MKTSRTHIHAFYIAFSAVMILAFTLLIILWNQRELTKSIAKEQEVATSVSKPETAASTAAESKFFISSSEVGCTKIATNGSSPVNTCNGSVDLVADTKVGDPATYTLHISNKTKLLQGGKLKDLTVLYKLENEQTLVSFTSDDAGNALTITYD